MCIRDRLDTLTLWFFKDCWFPFIDGLPQATMSWLTQLGSSTFEENRPSRALNGTDIMFVYNNKLVSPKLLKGYVFWIGLGVFVLRVSWPSNDIFATVLIWRWEMVKKRWDSEARAGRMKRDKTRLLIYSSWSLFEVQNCLPPLCDLYRTYTC